MASCVEPPYTIPSLASVLHDFPRYDFDFKKADNPTFDPNDQAYLEGLGIWAILIAAISILFLVVSLFYLVCKCCCCPLKRRVLLDEPKIARKWCGLATIALVSVAAVGTAAYGASKIFRDTDSIIYSANDIDAYLNQAKAEVLTITATGDDISSNLTAVLNLLPDNQTDLRTIVGQAIQKVDIVLNQVVDISERIDDVDFHKFVESGQEYRDYGEYGIISYFCYMGFVAVFPLLGLICCRTASSCLKWFAILALIGLLLCSVISGASTGVSLAGSDVCTDPDGYLVNLTSSPTDSYRDVLEYYVFCNNCSIPYSEYFDEAFKNVDELQTAFDTVEKSLPPGATKEYVQQAFVALNGSADALEDLQVLLQCDRVNGIYDEARDTLCKDLLSSLAILLFATLISSLSFMLLIVCEQMTWRRVKELNNYHDGYDKYDESSPLYSRKDRFV